MKALFGFIRLLRPLNLLIIVLTMYMLRYFIVGRALALNEFDFVLTNFEFAMLVLSTVLLAAAGNIINDYFDMRVDRINKPDKVILGRLVKRRWAMLIHFIFNFLAIGIGLWLSVKVEIWELFSVHIFAATSLWFYSVIFKRQFLIGNVVIGILAALVPLMIAMFEMPLIVKEYGATILEYYSQNMPDEDPQLFFKILYMFILGYAAFAFITTLIREIQKDMADYDGDKQVGCNTVPIYLGIKTTKIIVGFLIALVVVGLYMLVFEFFTNQINPNDAAAGMDYTAFWYFTLAVILPMFASMIFMFRAQNRKQHLIASWIMKVAMLGGILFPILIRLF